MTPTKNKTWQIDSNIYYLDPAMSSIGDTNARLFWLIKEKLTGLASNPWIVESSCDSVTAGNNDQVDHWADPATDLVWSGGGARSWIVLKQAALGGEASWCMEFDITTSNKHAGTIVFSPSAGFGAANGGADGTTTARPTATDEDVVVSGSSIAAQTSGTPTAQVMHIWASEDGTCTRIVVYQNASPVLVFWFDRAKSPIGAWSPPVVYQYDRGSTLAYSDFYTSTYWHFQHSGTPGEFSLALAGADGSQHNSDNRATKFPSSFNGRSALLPVSLLSETASLEGLWGMLFDTYAAPNNLPVGTVARGDNGNAEWAKIGDLWLPWSPAAGALTPG